MYLNEEHMRNIGNNIEKKNTEKTHVIDSAASKSFISFFLSFFDSFILTG